MVDEQQLRALVRQYFERTLEDIELAPRRSLDEAEALELSLYDDFERLQVALAENNYSSVNGLAAELLSGAGIELDRESSSYRRLCRELLIAEQALLRREQRSTQGEVDHVKPWYKEEAPTAPQGAATENKTTDSEKLSKIIAAHVAWKESQHAWTVRTRSDAIRAFNTLQGFVGDRPIGEIGTRDLQEYAGLVTRLPANYARRTESPSLRQLTEENTGKTLSAATVNKYFGFIKHLFSWAVDGGHIASDPSGVLRPLKTTRPQAQRDAFTDDELNVIFSGEYIADTRTRPDKYWIPLLLAYSGARSEEIAQLHKEDVKIVDEVWCIDIQWKNSESRLKTVSSARIVPIHSELIKRGFLEYVAGAPSGHLWPQLRRGKNGYGDAVGKWFNKRLRQLGFPPRIKVMHSLRHTVATRLKAEGVEDYLIAELLGHAHTGMTMGRYAKRLGVDKLQGVVERLQLPI